MSRYSFENQKNVQFLRRARESSEELIDDLNICIDEEYFKEKYLMQLKKEGYELLKKINDYISYFKQRKKSE